MKKYIYTIALAFGILAFSACSDDSSTDPNVLEGDTNLEATEVGSEFGIYIKMDGDTKGVLNNVEDSVVVTKRENGITTLSAKFVVSESTMIDVDTLLGIEILPEPTKRDIVDHFLKRFDAKLDTSDMEHITITTEIKVKATDKGIQDFVYSKGNTNKPFTLIKYDDGVGDKYTFTADDGTQYTREIVSKSTEDDYPLGFFNIKVTKVQETQPNDPLLKTISYYTNHKFGLVGIELETINGKIAKIEILPWAIL
ncbi:MAG: hypothetical protein CVV25_14725 [Ignavibacteriae bacterium HGW-Ignavibacteriae-4]|jgi:hypothetical protein|nr:MAG: hypothetical protein CVV25_14725 [Ignavibacteriae bacterium HGW-Ignavibacteriae-4]